MKKQNGPERGRLHFWRRGWDVRDGSLSRALRTLRVLRASLRLSKFVPDEFV